MALRFFCGVTRSLTAMVRQNLLWGAKESAQSYDDYVSEELGLDGFEVDAHSGCRPTHELIHWQNAEQYRKLYGNITKSNYEQHIEWCNKKAKKELDKIQKKGYNVKGVSRYSDTMYAHQNFDEVYTEYKTKVLLEGENQ